MNITPGLVAPEVLNERERAIFLAIACGYNTTEIAASLGVERTAVYRSRERILSKLFIAADTDIIRLAYAPAMKALAHTLSEARR